MSYCLNPACVQPHNQSAAQFCQSCGLKLLLQERYRALHLIGQGGFGRTFLATDEHLPSRPACVIKQFFPKGLRPEQMEKAIALFHQEALRLDQLGQHPQIPKLLAHFTQSPYHYLVQTYVDGAHLGQMLVQQGPLSAAEIRQLLNELLPVLQFIHDHQVIHRDIKPENIIRRRADQKLVLVDFGASKFITGAMSHQTGTVIGSAGYAAPEQIAGKAVFASDLYSLGVTCIHLLTNVSPFDLYSFTEGAWVWRDYLATPIDAPLAQVLDRLLHPATNQRLPSAAIALAALNPQTVTLPEATPPPIFIPLSAAPASGATWTCARSLRGHTGPVAAIAISPNGHLLATGGFDNLIHLWHLGTGSLVGSFTGHLEPVLALVFTLEGQALISGSVDNSIKLWHLHTGKLLYTLTENANSVLSLSVALSPDGQALVSGSDDHTVKIWQLSTGRLFRSLLHPRAVTCVAISPDGRSLVSGSNDNQVRVWNFGTGELLHTLAHHSRDVNSVAISPDSRLLASGGSDNTICLWDLASGELLQSLTGHLDWVRVVAISPDGKTLASGSDDHTIKLWELSQGQLRHTLPGHQKGVNAIAFHPNSQILVSGSGDRTVKIWRQDER